MEKVESKGKTKLDPTLYEGNFILTSACAGDKEPPTCYLADRTKMPRKHGVEADLDAIKAIFYPGAVCRLLVTVHAYEKSANSHGVGLLLRGIQFLKEGRRLTGPDVDAMMSEEAGDDGDWEFEDSELDNPTEGTEETADLNG